jgi:hypothetical protein
MPVAEVFQTYCCDHINHKYGHLIPFHGTGPVSHIIKRTFSIKTSENNLCYTICFFFFAKTSAINIVANQLYSVYTDT